MVYVSHLALPPTILKPLRANEFLMQGCVGMVDMWAARPSQSTHPTSPPFRKDFHLSFPLSDAFN